MSFDECIQKLKEVQRGWVNNFRMASILNKLQDIDGWIRNRLRYCIWSRSSGEKNLKRKGVALSVWELNKDKPMHGLVHVMRNEFMNARKNKYFMNHGWLGSGEAFSNTLK